MTTATRSRRRRLGPLAATLLAAALFPAGAQAALSIQPNDPLLGWPASITDTASGLALGPCQDASGFCIETPAPNPAAPLSVPGNYTPDGEAFYNVADANLPQGLVHLAIEQAFANEAIVMGDQMLFSRIRARLVGLKPGGKYRLTHPWGSADLTADITGLINYTEDAGCLTPPCDFAAAGYGAAGGLLSWDPTVAPAAPAGYAGNFTVAHAIVGSPTLTNFVRLEELDGTGAPVAVVSQTSQFLVSGKLAGPAPAPSALAVPDTASLTFDARQVGSATPARRITIDNRGTAPLNVGAATFGGPDAGDFAVGQSTCAGPVAPGASCTLDVVFTPQASGRRTATLSIASDTAGGAPLTVALDGTGTPATVERAGGGDSAPVIVNQIIHTTAPASAPKRLVLRAGDLRVARRVRVRDVRGRGIAAAFTAPRGSAVVRLRLFRAGSSKPVATKIVDLAKAGRMSVHLRARRAAAGSYRLEIALAPRDAAFSAPSGVALRIVR